MKAGEIRGAKDAMNGAFVARFSRSPGIEENKQKQENARKDEAGFEPALCGESGQKMRPDRFRGKRRRSPRSAEDVG
jgi:hypothetical protein